MAKRGEIPVSEISVPRKRGIHGVAGIKDVVQVKFSVTPEENSQNSDLMNWAIGGVALITACGAIESNLHIFQWLSQFVGH